MLGLRATHHVALKVKDLAGCAHFYRDLLGLPFLQNHHDAEGILRSIWLQLAHGTILMLERVTEVQQTTASACGWHLMALTIRPDEREHLERSLLQQGIAITGRTDFTLYIADPEGNRLGLSHYPVRAASTHP